MRWRRPACTRCASCTTIPKQSVDRPNIGDDRHINNDSESANDGDNDGKNDGDNDGKNDGVDRTLITKALTMTGTIHESDDHDHDRHIESDNDDRQNDGDSLKRKKASETRCMYHMKKKKLQLFMLQPSCLWGRSTRTYYTKTPFTTKAGSREELHIIRSKNRKPKKDSLKKP
jgi:hypothetical protein